MGVVPVVTIGQAHDAARLADTFVEAGLPCAEIALRTSAAVKAIQSISKRGDMLVGAGTVLSIGQVKAAVDAGAEFLFSPGFNPKIAGYCLEHDILHIPGICTPSGIEAALELGLHVLKFFPAEAYGGLKTLKAISGPYPDVAFIPTGGINFRNLADYLRYPAVLACGGTWLADAMSISSGRFQEIRLNIKQAVQTAKDCAGMER